MTRGRLLLVTPAFHGYWRSIGAAFAARGWTVVTHCYDVEPTAWRRARAKLRTQFPAAVRAGGVERAAHDQAQRARVAVHRHRPDRVLVIKGDTLGEPFLDALARPRVKASLWLYDELRRMLHTPTSLAAYDTVASYSRLDAAALSASGLAASYVPLAFDPSAAVRPKHTPEVTLVGARYPRREALLRALVDADVPVRAYGRDWSSHPVDRVRTWRLRAVGIPSGRDLPLSEAYRVMAGSPATLNIHGDQDGFTMRTFEAAGVGGVQLVDRADVDEFYEPGREVVVFSDEHELIEAARRALADDRWGDGIRAAAQRRTLREHTFAHRAAALEATWA